MFGLQEEFSYFQCSRCNCLQIAEFPENMGKFYQGDNYYSLKEVDPKIYKGLTGYFRRVRTRANVLADSMGDRLIKLIFPNKNVAFLDKVVTRPLTRILDVGCGNGARFLYPLYEVGFENVEGCDPFIDGDVEYTDKFKIVKDEIFELNDEKDLICFNHSFEHIPNPLETLQKSNELLKKGGYCIIRIPTTCSSFAWKHYGVNWFQLDAPRHFFLHSIESIRYLCERTNFELEDTVFDSTHHQFTISERYKQGRSIKERTYTNSWERLVNMIQKVGFQIRAKKLNRQQAGDQAIFYLRKI